MSLRERLIDPRSPERRPRRAACALPRLFTAGNVFLGFYALLEVFHGAMGIAQGTPFASLHFQTAGALIGWAVFLDGLDGRIARMTNTVSDFGREMDSLADVIAFGLAPATLTVWWGLMFVQPSMEPVAFEYLNRPASFLPFLFLLFRPTP